MSARDEIWVAERTIGALPLSIGTSLAFETYLPSKAREFDPDRKLPVPEKPLTYYETVGINVLTLYRNMLDSLGTEKKRTVNIEAVVQGVHDEMQFIEELCRIEFSGALTPYFYILSHDKVYRNTSLQGWVRIAATKIQKQELRRLKRFITMISNLPEFDKVSLTSDKFNVRYANSLILTHVARDLLYDSAFKHLTLLESHTGETKERERWNTKFTKTKLDLSRLPFNHYTLNVYGDPTHHKPHRPRLRKDVLEVATKQKWHPLTRYAVVKRDIKRYGTADMNDLLLIIK